MKFAFVFGKSLLIHQVHMHKGFISFSYPLFHYFIKKVQRAKKWLQLTWRRHQMETFSALLALCAGNSPVTAEFPAQRPVQRNFDASFDMGLNKRLSKQSWVWWFETRSGSLWHHYNGYSDRWQGAWTSTREARVYIFYNFFIIVFSYQLHLCSHPLLHQCFPK